MNLAKKIAIILTIFGIIFVCNFSTSCFAETATSSSVGLDSILNQGSDFINKGAGSDTDGIIDGFSEAFLPVGRILVGIATVVIAIVTAIMGIKWITANPEQQAKLKQQLIGLVVSIIVIWGAVGIWELVKGIMENLTK